MSDNNILPTKEINFEVHLRKTHINTEIRKYQIN